MAIFVNPSTGKMVTADAPDTTGGFTVNLDNYTPGQAAPAPAATPAPTQTATPAPVTTPQTPAPVKQTTTTTPITPPSATTTETFNKAEITKNIQDSYNKATGKAKANEAFINAVSRAIKGKNATDDELGKTVNKQYNMVGRTLDQVLKAFDPQGTLLGATPGMGIVPPENNIDGVAGAGATSTGTTVEETNTDPVSAAIDKLIAIKQSGKAEGVDMGKYLEEKNRTATDVELARQSIADKQLIDAETLKTIEGRPIPMTMINRQKEGYTSDQYITDLKMTQDYNNKLILAKMAEGNFLEAQNISKDIANDNYEIAKLQIEKARNEQAITEKEAERLDEENAFQRKLGLEGYVLLSGPSQLKGLTEDQIWRDPVSNRIYKKPLTTGEPFTLSTGQTRFDAAGNVIASGGYEMKDDPLDKLLSPNELALFNAPAGSTMRDVMGSVPKTELTEVQKYTQEIKLGKEFEALVGDSRAAATSVSNINASLAKAEEAVKDGKSLNAASQGVLVAFQKLLDPQSVVRESEYARSGSGQALLEKIDGAWQKITQGGAGVTIEGLRDFTSTANTFLNGYKESALIHAKRMKVIADRQGLDINSILSEDMVDLVNKESEPFSDVQSWIDTKPANEEKILEAIEAQNLSPDEALQLINEIEGRTSFNSVGGDTNKAIVSKAIQKEDGTKGGQCGAFVNKLTGIGVGDSYASKMAKMDPSIKRPAPGMVFTMPYKQYGHVGIIVGIDGDQAIVKDSNYGLDEKVKTHKIPLSKMTGFANV